LDATAQATIVTRTADYGRQQLAGDSTGHDWWHIYRVWRTALRLVEAEGADRFVVELAALLHDLDDWKLHDGDGGEPRGPLLARAWLEGCAVDAGVVAHVCAIIEHLSFKGAGVPTPMSSIEGMIVQDADRLDALGAIGIARAFAYGGAKGRLLHDPGIQPQLHSSFEHYRASQSTTVNHFYEKLLLLQERMNTPSARAIAERRTRTIEAFLAAFYREWDGQDEV
jgi:uncharacterized protein